MEPLFQPVNITRCFSPSYEDARQKFLVAAAHAGAGITSHRNSESGPDGRPLFTDVAMFGSPEAEKTLAIQCGTHGIEGFCGSALQIAFLEGGLAMLLPADVRVVMIHAINPFGFAWLRRTDENNVDLNRNFVGHSGDYPENLNYDALNRAINPEDYSEEAFRKATAELLAYVEEHGVFGFREALTLGQYSHPEGLYFGGHFEVWSSQTFRRIVANCFESAQQLAFIDVHTGVGAYGEAEMILNVQGETEAYARAREWWGDRARSVQVGNSQMSPIEGSIKEALARMLPQTQVTAASMELGTFDEREVFLALHAEGWLRRYADETHAKASTILNEMRRIFGPPEVAWQRRVWSVAQSVVSQTLRGLDGQALPDVVNRGQLV